MGPRLECGRADARGAQRGREVALARFALLPSDGGQDCPGQAHGLRRCVCATTRVHSPTTVAPPCALLRVRLIGCIGGLEESVTEDIVRAAFVPFGEIIDVNLPLDSTTQKHRGFAFVQFDDKGDAADAIDNMNGGELFGRVLRVNLAKPDAAMRGSHRPVWEANADGYFKGGGENGEDIVETEDLE